MISGSVRDAEKPIIIVAPGGLPSVWLRVRGSHDVQSSLFTAAHQQDGYPDATESRCSLSTIQKSLLDGGVHTRLLGVGSAKEAGILVLLNQSDEFLDSLDFWRGLIVVPL